MLTSIVHDDDSVIPVLAEKCTKKSYRVPIVY